MAEEPVVQESSNNNSPTINKDDADWKSHIQPHGDLIELYPGKLWMVEGSMKSGIFRNMAIYKMSDGGLWLHSVVTLNDETIAKVEAIGTPTVLVIPNGQHTLDAGVYSKRYPQAAVITPSAMKETMLKKGLRIDSIAEEYDLADKGVKVVSISGLKPSGGSGIGGERAYEVQLDEGKTGLVVCDILMDHVTHPYGAIKGYLLGHTFGCCRLVKWLLLSDKSAFRGWLDNYRKQAESGNLACICLAHGPGVIGPENVAKSLQKAITEL